MNEVNTRTKAQVAVRALVQIKETSGPKPSIPAGKNGMKPVHPGEMITELFMKPLEMDIVGLSVLSGLPIKAIEPVIKMEAPITKEIAEGLSKVFNTTTQLWFNMQESYDKKISNN